MTVLATYATARVWFAPVFGVTGAADNGAGLIRLTVPSHPYRSGLVVNVQGVDGTTEANNVWTVNRISSTQIDLVGSTFTHAYTGGGRSQLLAADGLPAWPGPLRSDGSYDNTGNLITDLLRANGFANTWQVTTAGSHIWTPANCGPIGALIAGAVAGGDPLFPFRVTINSSAADSGGDAYGWFLSQRGEPVRYPSTLFPTTITPTNQPQLLTCTQLDDTHSGTVVVGVNSTEVLKLFPSSGGVPPTDVTSLATIFRNVHLYVTRRSDLAFQWARLVAATQ